MGLVEIPSVVGCSDQNTFGSGWDQTEFLKEQTESSENSFGFGWVWSIPLEVGGNGKIPSEMGG